MPLIVQRTRLVGVLWVLAGLVLLLAAFRTEPASTPYLVIGVGFVALGAALIRRSKRS